MLKGNFRKSFIFQVHVMNVTKDFRIKSSVWRNFLDTTYEPGISGMWFIWVSRGT